MTTYTNVFGGNAVRPADQSLSQITLSANTTLVWPEQGGSPATSAIVEVSPTAGSLSLSMPDARNAGEGETVTFKNIGANTFSVLDNTGGSIVSVASGQVFTVYLRDNATQAGTWSYWQAGAGTSQADAGSLDGAGLDALNGLLRVKANTQTFSSSQAFSDNDRGSCAVWTGGSGTFTAPNSTSVGNGWFMIYKNAGSGTLQIASGVSQTFDGGSDITLAPTEGATVFANGSNFSFVKHGSSGVSSFSYTSISIAGTGNYTLSASEYAKTAIKLTGTLTGNRNVIVPAAVRDYWINNATSGAFSVTVKTSGGSGVVVTQGKKSTLYCDGTDVIAADTDYPSGISTPVVVADGGTGATTADAALTNLGGTTTGKSLFTAASGASARSALSAAASGANTDISSVYLNNTGLKVRDTDASNGLSIVPGSNLSADRTLTVTTGDASRTLDISAGNVTISSAGAALIDDATAADQRTTLGLVIGTNVQAYDAELAALAGLISAADRLPYFTGAGTAALATFTSAGRALIDDADAAAQRTTLGLGTAATLDETTAAQFRNNTADKVLSTDQVWSAAGRVALTWSSGGTTAVDLNAGINFTLTTSTGNSTLGAPTNAKTGQSGFIEITQDAVTPRTLGFASAWVFDGGTDPTLTATASAKDILYYTVLDSTGPVVHATLRKAVA